MTRSTGTGPEVSTDINAPGVFPIDSVFRVTGVYKRVNREGKLIQIVDLFRFDQMISARSYVLATESPPQIDGLVKVKNIVRNDEFGAYPRLHSMTEIDAAESGLCSFEFPYPEWRVDEELIRRARSLDPGWSRIPSCSIRLQSF